MTNNDSQPVIVTIICLVYNHKPYLRQCLEGFVMQESEFKFEAIVHDDCSTDDSTAIIQQYASKYPNIIKPMFEEENQYHKIGFSGIYKLIQPHIQGKYVAFCEGDDYWTDPLKLKLEVNYLDSHPNVGLIYTQANQFEEETGERSLSWAKQTNFEKLLTGLNTIVTLTTCIRSELFFKYLQEINPPKTWLMADYPLWLYIAYKTEVFFMDRTTGEYRILKNSASHSTDINKQVKFIESALSIRLYLDKRLCGSMHTKQLYKDAVVDYFNISKAFDTNLSKEILETARKGNILSLRIVLKIIVYSNRYGRLFLRNFF